MSPTNAPFCRRDWLKALAFASLSDPGLFAAQATHLAPRARRIIYLTQAGAPSQIELFDHKPALATQFDKDLPDSIRNGQRLTGMTAGQKRFPIAPSVYKFQQHGQSGMWLSELLPHTSKFADDLCLIRSMHTEAINHDPAMTLLQTGHQIGGRPSFGAWVSYGLGSENSDLPAFVALISRPSGPTNAQPLHERMWGSGFLPSKYQGVRMSSGKDSSVWMNRSRSAMQFSTSPGGGGTKSAASGRASFAPIQFCSRRNSPGRLFAPRTPCMSTEWISRMRRDETGMRRMPCKPSFIART
jgi:hypothetical protein